MAWSIGICFCHCKATNSEPFQKVWKASGPSTWHGISWKPFHLESFKTSAVWRNFTCRATNWDHFQKIFFGISAVWKNLTCRATNWEHFHKVFFGILVASAVSTCRTTVWRNCPAESRRETMRIWYFLNSGSFRGLCPLVFQWRFEPGFVEFQTWVYFGRLESRVLKNSEVLWKVLELWSAVWAGWSGGLRRNGVEKRFPGFRSHLEGSGSVRNVTVISQSFAKSLENASAGSRIWMNLKGSEEMAQCSTGSGGPRSIQNVD